MRWCELVFDKALVVMTLTLRPASDIAFVESSDVDNSDLINRCVGAYAHFERIFEDTPEKVSKS